MSKEHFGTCMNSTNNNYTMLANLCGNTSQMLGVKAVAPVFNAYNSNPAMQSVPVFRGANYDMAPYEYNLLTRCGNCGGNYCNALKAYACDDKNSVAYVSRGDGQVVNQTCATGNCKTGFGATVYNSK